MITPAISVLSAVEGLKVVDPRLDEWIVPITAVIIVGLFAVQRHGTATVGRFFGPVMIVWFVRDRRLGCAGHRRPSRRSSRRCRRPMPSASWSGTSDIAFFALAAVVLAVTGAEALYADMGHFGRRAITRGWLFLVLPGVHSATSARARCPARRQSAVSAPFFLLTPGWAQLPMVGPGHRRDGDRLTGGDHRGLLGGIRRPPSSVTCPRLRVAHTSASTIGPDLRAVDQRLAHGGGAHPGVRVPQLGGAGLRLRHGGDRDDHHHHAAVLLHRAQPVALAAVGRAHRRRGTVVGRPDVLRGQPDQAGARRLAAAADRHLARSP